MVGPACEQNELKNLGREGKGKGWLDRILGGGRRDGSRVRQPSYPVQLHSQILQVAQQRYMPPCPFPPLHYVIVGIVSSARNSDKSRNILCTYLRKYANHILPSDKHRTLPCLALWGAFLHNLQHLQSIHPPQPPKFHSWLIRPGYVA